MDEFDKKIQNAKQTYEPKSNFAENSVEKLPIEQPKNHFNWKIWAPATAGVVAIVVVVFIVLPKPIPNNTNDISNKTDGSSSQSIAPTAGTDDTSLQNDLNSAQASVDQTSNEQDNADSAVNDSSQQITVPTE
jgi:hypothetical protein